jgi:hypothetical protein
LTRLQQQQQVLFVLELLFATSWYHQQIGFMAPKTAGILPERLSGKAKKIYEVLRQTNDVDTAPNLGLEVDLDVDEPGEVNGDHILQAGKSRGR